MKKVLCLLFVSLFLFGCEKKVEEKESKMLDNINSYIDSYNSGSISFKELTDKVVEISKDYCNDESRMCSSIDEMVTFNNRKNDLYDCSQYEDDDVKEKCELGNTIIKDSISRQSDAEKNLVNELKRNCDQEIEENKE